MQDIIEIKPFRAPLVTATLQKGLKEPEAELERHGQRHVSEDGVSPTCLCS